MSICSICKKYDTNEEFQTCEEFDCSFCLCDECLKIHTNMLDVYACHNECYNCRYKRTIQIDNEKFENIKIYCLELIDNAYVKVKKSNIKQIIRLINGDKHSLYI